MVIHLPALDDNNARHALLRAAQDTGLDGAGATLIRLGENAVFRLKDGSVVARVARDEGRLDTATREIAVARWLAGESVPAVSALDVRQPIVAEGRVVTFWNSISDKEDYGTTTALANILHRVHALLAPKGIDLPHLDPFDRAWSRINRSQALKESDRDFLRDLGTRLRESYSSLVFVLPMGVIHGDANVGNVLVDRGGRSVLADLDGFAVGPREWDLVLTAMYFELYGWHTEDEYRQFVQSYGFDIMEWPGYPILRDTREFLMVTWLAQNAGSPGRTADELQKRLATLRLDRGSRKDWKPF